MQNSVIQPTVIAALALAAALEFGTSNAEAAVLHASLVSVPHKEMKNKPQKKTVPDSYTEKAQALLFFAAEQAITCLKEQTSLTLTVAGKSSLARKCGLDMGLAWGPVR